MSRTAIFALLCLVSTQLASSAAIPDKFFGAWTVEKSENFDEYLSAKGVGWFVRQMIKIASLTKIFDKKSDGSYAVENRSSKGTTKWEGIRLEHQFEGKGMDGTVHKITFSFANDILTERHIRTYEGKEIDETYRYSIEDGKLVMKLTAGNIVARRWFKSVPLPKD